MKLFESRPSFSGYTAADIVRWYYDRAWNTMNGAKRAIVARTVDLYINEIDDSRRTVRFNLPENPDDADQFLSCNKKNVKVIDDFFADNTVRNKHFRDSLEIYVARAIDEIFETDCCEILKQRLFPEEIVPHTQEQLDALLVETNSTYTDAVNECVRVFRNGLTDDSEEELEILESKLLKAREKIDKNVGAIENELQRRKQEKLNPVKE
ncbi:MAG: hypothetical protein R3F41_06385 [Gammaproteobacteria bacterium]|nr:hypothetical protein [Pseudomonadales bacterium]MCP5348543.1 hypothetical protein [Pseudomonadales bacterium]